MIPLRSPVDFPKASQMANLFISAGEKARTVGKENQYLDEVT